MTPMGSTRMLPHDNYGPSFSVSTVLGFVITSAVSLGV